LGNLWKPLGILKLSGFLFLAASVGGLVISEGLAILIRAVRFGQDFLVERELLNEPL
jgi:hypothetical protein